MEVRVATAALSFTFPSLLINLDESVQSFGADIWRTVKKMLLSLFSDQHKEHQTFFKWNNADHNPSGASIPVSGWLFAFHSVT